MTRYFLLVMQVCTGAVLVAPARADDPPKKLTAEERNLYQAQGKLGDAEPLFKDALEMYKRLLKGQDHPHLASSLNNLAYLWPARNKSK